MSPTDPKAYGDAKMLTRASVRHTTQCPKRQLSHQQTKTATDEARTASVSFLVEFDFYDHTQTFDRTQKNSNKDPYHSTNHDSTLIDITNTSQWISHSPSSDSAKRPAGK
jgi:hypothetical protein